MKVEVELTGPDGDFSKTKGKGGGWIDAAQQSHRAKEEVREAEKDQGKKKIW